MGDLSRHFSRNEFACQCGCGQDTVDAELIRVLEAVRSLYGRVQITSGVRCPEHNKAVGGSSNSQHLYGKAADFVVLTMDEDSVASYLETRYAGKYGIGRYEGRTHVDVKRGHARRWDNR